MNFGLRMPELTPKERLQPSLLDRLIDDAPEKKQESREKRVLSMRRIRQSVLRDLSWLLNTSSLEAVENLDAYPLVKASVLNFGIPDLAGTVIAGTDVSSLERSLKQAILDFEPRILRNTVKIQVYADDRSMNQNAMVFEIQGDLWAQPLPQKLYLKTVVDLDTHQVEIDDLNR